VCKTGNRQPLFSKKVKKEGQEERNQDAGGKGEIEGEILTLYGDIPRKPPEPGNFIGENQEHAQSNHQAAENNQYFTDSAHGDPFPDRGGLGW
jgi:hypothetical protein